MQTWVVATALIGVYLLLTLGVGAVANRRLTLNVEDFFLYGRRAGFVVLYLTVVGTYHSAFAFLGSSGFFYTHGIGFWDAGTWTIMTGAITYVLGTRVWALGRRFGYITPADLLADFYESEAVRVVTALVSVVFTILYIQVQAQGLGYIINVATDGRVSFEIGTLILITIAAAYLMAGGIRAVYWTDVLKGFWMYLALWAGGLFLAYRLFGGPGQLWNTVVEQRPDLLTLPGPNGYFTPGMWFGLTIVFSFGIVFQPHMMIRYYSAISDRTIKWIGATTPIYLITIYIPAALVGLGGAIAVPNLDTPDRVFPELLFTYAPAWLTGIVLAGATAAAMSTLDSILHANTTVLTRDIYQRYITRNASQAHYINVGRIIVLALLAVGYFLSIRTFELLVVIVSLSGAGALQLMPAVLGVCFPSQRVLTRTGVLAGIATGLVTLYITLVLTPHPLGIHAGVWSVLANGAVTLITSRFTRPPSTATVARIHGEVERVIYGGREGRTRA
ncbi:MAG: sodium:solute symporter family protein [Longimicrobiales bacterium]